MTTQEVSKRLAKADEHLASAVDSLIGMNSTQFNASQPLQEAAALLAGIDPKMLPKSDRATFEAPLASLARQAATAGRLLESAASLYFGNLLASGLVAGGYASDGASDSFGGGGFRIEG